MEQAHYDVIRVANITFAIGVLLVVFGGGAIQMFGIAAYLLGLLLALLAPRTSPLPLIGRKARLNETTSQMFWESVRMHIGRLVEGDSLSERWTHELIRQPNPARQLKYIQTVRSEGIGGLDSGPLGDQIQFLAESGSNTSVRRGARALMNMASEATVGD